MAWSAVAAPAGQPTRTEPSVAAAPTFEQSYLRGVNGARPAKTVDLAGTWKMRTVPASGTDTVPTDVVLNATADAKSWSMTLPSGTKYNNSQELWIARDLEATERF
jgi:hypothetical protein